VAAAAAVVVSNVVVVVVVVAYEVRPYRVGVGDSWSWWLEAGVSRIDVYWLVARKNIDIAAAVAVYDSESVSLAEGLSAVHLTPVNEMFAAHDDRSV
jgi:hypothetical protein